MDAEQTLQILSYNMRQLQERLATLERRVHILGNQNEDLKARYKDHVEYLKSMMPPDEHKSRVRHADA